MRNKNETNLRLDFFILAFWIIFVGKQNNVTVSEFIFIKAMILSSRIICVDRLVYYLNAIPKTFSTTKQSLKLEAGYLPCL